MRRGATKVSKSNSMNEARMSEITSQIGPQMRFELLFNTATGAMCRANTTWSSAKLPPCATPPRHRRVRPMGRDLRDGPRLAEGMAALG